MTTPILGGEDLPPGNRLKYEPFKSRKLDICAKLNRVFVVVVLAVLILHISGAATAGTFVGSNGYSHSLSALSQVSASPSVTASHQSSLPLPDHAFVQRDEASDFDDSSIGESYDYRDEFVRDVPAEHPNASVKADTVYDEAWWKSVSDRMRTHGSG